MLSKIEIDKAAKLLTQARNDNTLLDCIPEEIRPGSLSEAYAVQDQLIQNLGLPIGGWYCACTNQKILIVKVHEESATNIWIQYFPHTPQIKIILEPKTTESRLKSNSVIVCLRGHITILSYWNWKKKLYSEGTGFWLVISMTCQTPGITSHWMR